MGKIALLVVGLLALPTTLFGQFPEIPEIRGLSVIDAGGFGGSTSISVSQRDGVKTTKVTDNGKKFLIKESAEDGIKFTYTKTYGPKDLDKLKVDYPGLFMHAEGFPTETDEEDTEVQLNINIKKTISAQNKDEFKKDHPNEFALYKKYTSGRAGGAIRFGGLRGVDFDRIRGLRGIPRIEIRGIEGGDIQLEIDEEEPDEEEVEEEEIDT